MRFRAASLSAAVIFPFSAAGRGCLRSIANALRDRGVGDVHHHHVEAGDGARLRDAVAHRSGADDADLSSVCSWIALRVTEKGLCPSRATDGSRPARVRVVNREC
mgnify:CR=1 FL=1